MWLRWGKLKGGYASTRGYILTDAVAQVWLDGWLDDQWNEDFILEIDLGGKVE